MVSIMFFKASTVWGKLICAFTGKPYAHVGVGHALFNRPYLTHSYERFGVCCWPAGVHFSPDVTVQVPWIDEAWAVPWLADNWGGSYGWADFLLFPFKKTRLGRGNHAGVICSEFVILFLQAAIQRRKLSFLWTPAEKAIMEINDPSAVSPGALYDLVSTLMMDGPALAA